MSSHIWTADALKSSEISLSGECWRLVEAQHLQSTIKLTDNLIENNRLEDLLEESKPLIPNECDDLDFLLFTPFRYEPAPNGSRFRRAKQREGAFYASEAVETAVAEMAYYKYLFFCESPQTPVPANGFEYHAFCIEYETRKALDLTKPPLSKSEALWMDKSDYSSCQMLADGARKNNVMALVSYSVRCPQKGKNITILHPAAFKSRKPSRRQQTWHITLKPDIVLATKRMPFKTLSFLIEDLV